MKIVAYLLLALLMACTTREKTSQPESVPIDDTLSVTNPDEPVVSYQAFYGTYVLESAAGGFTATLVIEPRGNDMGFTLTSRKGDSCKGELSGAVAIVSHSTYYSTGYTMEESCKLEFSFRHEEEKIDIKEIHLCTAHDATCGFEGTYAKVRSLTD